MYYLNVSDLHQPTFCIYLPLYPAGCSAFHPMDLMEWVYIYLIPIPFISGYASFMASSLSTFDILSFLIFCHFPNSKNSHTKQSNFPLFFLRFTYRLPIALNRFKYGYPFFHGICMTFCVRFSDSSVSILVPLHPRFLCLLLSHQTGAGFFPCCS